MEHYREAIRLKPGLFDAHNNLGVALEAAGQPEEAKAHYLEALRIQPDFARPHTNLGNWYAARGEFAEAIQHYAEVTRLRPEAAEPVNRLARVLATCPEVRFRDAAKAVKLAEWACAVTKQADPRMLDTLAAAYAEAGRFEEAVETATKALRVAEAREQSQLAVGIQERIALYASAKPFREPRDRAGAPQTAR